MNIPQRLLAVSLAVLTLQGHAAEPLPRVFFTEPERAAIVARRGTDRADLTAGAAIQSDAAPAAAAPARAARLEGISIAHGGGNFAWIDGKRYANGARYGNHRLEVSRQGLILHDSRGRTRRIRVGEQIDAQRRTTVAAP
jgi:hypothetical protein